MDRRTYRALIADRSFDVTIEDERLTLDDTPLRYVFDRVGEGYFSLLVDGRSIPVVITPMDDGRLRVTVGSHTHIVSVKDEHDLLLERFGLAEAAGAAEREIRAPMPGLVLDVLVTEGQTVQAGDGLLVLEAMKMENELRTPTDGVVQKIHVAPNDAVDKDALLIEIDAEPA